MSYKDLISNAIESSDFSIKEIAEQCKKYGVSITPSYISLLKSGKTSNPSEEVSRAIANVCGIDENVLIIEAYLEKAPYILKTLLNRFKYEKDDNKIRQLDYFEKTIEDSEEKEIVYNNRDYIKKRSLAEFIVDAYETLDPNPTEEEIATNSRFQINKEKIYDNEIANFMKVNITDSSMNPLIPKNSKVYFEKYNSYKNGDIICFKIKNKDKDNMLVRKYFMDKNLLILTALNTKFEPMIYNYSEIDILGKVIKIITNL